MNRRRFVQAIGATGLGLLAGCTSPLAALPLAPKVYLIGYLQGALPNASNDALMLAFRQGMRDLGYVEGEHFLMEERYADGADQLAEPAAELVRLRPDVILVPSLALARTAQAATTTIPIVCAGSGDLLTDGLVKSLARPGGNLTGLSTPSLGGKQLQILLDAVPTLSRVAVLYDATGSVTTDALDAGARALGLGRVLMGARGPEDIDPGFETAVREQADGLIVSAGPVMNTNETRIAELAMQSHLPSMWSQTDAVSQGGLMAYAPNRPDMYRRSATYVDKILKGAKPADLPIEQPDTFDFVINVRTAQALGLTIPPAVLVQATEIIQ